MFPNVVSICISKSYVWPTKNTAFLRLSQYWCNYMISATNVPLPQDVQNRFEGEKSTDYIGLDLLFFVILRDECWIRLCGLQTWPTPAWSKHICTHNLSVYYTLYIWHGWQYISHQYWDHARYALLISNFNATFVNCSCTLN